MDRLIALDTVGQIPRHVLVQMFVTDQEPYGRLFGQKERCLTGPVPTSHNRHRLAAAELGFHLGCSKVHGGVLELLDVWDLETAVTYPGGDEDRP